MSEVTVKTNNVPRSLLYWHELSPRERKEFDYMTPEEQYDAAFVRYRGWVYDIADTMAITDIDRNHPQREWMKGWDSYVSDSFFSGVLFRWLDDGLVVCGTYYC